jgi:hypothetical protein
MVERFGCVSGDLVGHVVDPRVPFGGDGRRVVLAVALHELGSEDDHAVAVSLRLGSFALVVRVTVVVLADFGVERGVDHPGLQERRGGGGRRGSTEVRGDPAFMPPGTKGHSMAYS